jgi:aspartyl-tRNA(Asn)/glutamyl-tRNA(Gln) amidotransferase subunit C
MIGDQEVQHVARLARLALDGDERVLVREQLSAILQYIAKLEELDVSDVPPTSHAVPLVNVMRDDDVQPCLAREDALANAPDRAGDLFRVPRIIEDG